MPFRILFRTGRDGKRTAYSRAVFTFAPLNAALKEPLFHTSRSFVAVRAVNAFVWHD